jgi:hypothetical protein
MPPSLRFRRNGPPTTLLILISVIIFGATIWYFCLQTPHHRRNDDAPGLGLGPGYGLGPGPGYGLGPGPGYGLGPGPGYGQPGPGYGQPGPGYGLGPGYGQPGPGFPPMFNMPTAIGGSAPITMPSGQLGYLTKEGSRGDESVLPLMGTPLQRNRTKWSYYTVTDQRSTNIKLPVYAQGRDCSASRGCDELMCGDTVTVNGQAYRVKMYEKGSAFSYSPF